MDIEWASSEFKHGMKVESSLCVKVDFIDKQKFGKCSAKSICHIPELGRLHHFSASRWYTSTCFSIRSTAKP